MYFKVGNMILKTLSYAESFFVFISGIFDE
ncbi:hypothetical protein C8P70_12020 [Myroides indicus]|uniref:Uncharacterized protein n=1 Tax=Myroides indicus TaxID=1323422 RepID=A0A4R7F0Q0_9FLAO|nr:hypothetical protein C8P70_12020 [Myroides indicus]